MVVMWTVEVMVMMMMMLIVVMVIFVMATVVNDHGVCGGNGHDRDGDNDCDEVS